MKKPILFTFYFLLFTLLSVSALAQSGGKPDVDAQQTGKVFWRGMVDAKVRLVIRDSTLTVQTMEGTAQPDGVSSFTASLPRREVSVGVNKTEGRGTATVIQQPTGENDYTAVVEIVDTKGGAKEYQVEIFWK